MTAEPSAEALRLTLWGVGGSSPTGRAARARFGGDTICFEIRRERAGQIDPTALVIDLGSGARDLGKALSREAAAQDRPAQAEILISHLHLDHIVGAPFFAPFYQTEAELRLRCGLHADPDETREALRRFASPPYFPIKPLGAAHVAWASFAPGEPIEAAGLTVRTIALNHPGGCCGFRIESPGGDICVIGDHEHGDPAIDAAVEAFVQGAALMLYDATYMESELERHRGWGHSTLEEGLSLAARAGIGRTLLYHHQPELDDEALEARDTLASAASDRVSLARQGMVWRLAGGEAARQR